MLKLNGVCYMHTEGTKCQASSCRDKRLREEEIEYVEPERKGILYHDINSPRCQPLTIHFAAFTSALLVPFNENSVGFFSCDSQKQM